uniref:Uncharacterized protein n=1 Tax=Aegilops tauschii subsp. strangulata TaxID=200361 RepID=A0A453E6Y4_AEGTS
MKRRGVTTSLETASIFLFCLFPSREVTKISVKHKCSSTGRIKNSMTSQGWVAQRTVPLIQSDPTIGCKELLENLQDTYGTTTDYHTVWKGKDIAQKEIYGSMRQSFQYLFNFEAEVEKRSPGNIVEVDMKMVHGCWLWHWLMRHRSNLPQL